MALKDGSGVMSQIPADSTIMSNMGTGNSTSCIVSKSICTSGIEEGQTAQFWGSIDEPRGSAKISGIQLPRDPYQSTVIFFSEPLPYGVTAGDLLIVDTTPKP